MVALKTREESAAQFGMFSLWAEHDERAKLIVDDQFAILWANTAALDLIEGMDPIGSSRRQADGAGRPWSGWLRQIAQSVVGATTWISLPQAGGRHLSCTAIQLRGEEGEVLIGLTLRTAPAAPTIEDDTLRGLFQLTNAERRIVQALFTGRTAEEAGAVLHISVGTVRVHIRHIYEKLAVGSREAMFHKLLPYVSA